MVRFPLGLVWSLSLLVCSFGCVFIVYLGGSKFGLRYIGVWVGSLGWLGRYRWLKAAECAVKELGA